ncbi:helix-turn-helix domain-containing protein [Pseudoroseicyclus aestuarii]|uniref:AraC family transcriptional regulator n=1 Tax=Pseudoroseicyclus aestuarii TaxID=1795041 RepID=A0A318STC4_9RHOB|nr:helix-turn-helix domain-containing protein [Pseudoroseicyclus aestuarii]PYE82419.1 AraC family transcriptional regulator [Pseudoroseicyclus aestuarii]
MAEETGAELGGPAHERHFYALTKAIGRFGMRVFSPSAMEAAHWHGHVEANFLTGAEMEYDLDGLRVVVPPGRLALFWAGIPHRLVRITPQGDGPPRLANIYLPVDGFLSMPHIAGLQVGLMSGGLLLLPPGACGPEDIDRWYADYRSHEVERAEVMRMEINTLLRRAQIGPPEWLCRPLSAPEGGIALSAQSVRHVVAMVRVIVEGLHRPMTNADIAAVTGLHESYATQLFSRMMRMPPKRFLVRMRLLRARALLMESGTPIAQVAEESGFSSISQFYAQFRAAYGLPPKALRDRYAAMALR